MDDAFILLTLVLKKLFYYGEAIKMAKKKILQKQKESSEITVVECINEDKLERHEPFEYILNKKNLIETVVECLKNNDFEGVFEVIDIYIKTLKKAKKSQKSPETNATKKREFETHGCYGDVMPKFANGKKTSKLKKLI